MSHKFKELSEKIQDPIDYAKEEIIMSNVAFCIISEYVGRTIMDVVLLSKSSPYYDKLIGSPFTLEGYPLFTKYMFELCYKKSGRISLFYNDGYGLCKFTRTSKY